MNLVLGWERRFGEFLSQKKGVEKIGIGMIGVFYFPRWINIKTNLCIFFSLGEAKKSEVLGWCYICNDNPNCTKLSA